MRKTSLALSLVLCLAAAMGCGKEAPPVAQVEVQPATLRLDYPQVKTVRLTLTPSAALDGGERPMVFAHLTNSHDQIVRTFDHPLAQPWAEGTPIVDTLRLNQSVLAPPLPAGTYPLRVGLYGKGGKRWPLGGLGADLGRNEYVAAQIEVPAEEAGPKFAWTPSWLPTEVGADRQVVARRWLVGRGAIGVSDMKVPGTVWLLVRIPAGDQAGEKLEIEGGGNSPAVVIRGNCGPEINISGPGNHEVEVPVDTAPEEGNCRINLIPNFTYYPAPPQEKRSVAVENAAWIPGPPAVSTGAPALPPAAAPTAPAAPAAPTAAPAPSGHMPPPGAAANAPAMAETMPF